MAHVSGDDGLSTIGEITTGAYIWFFSILVISATMAYKFAGYDSELYHSKNKYIDITAHRENRLSSASMPPNEVDSRTHSEFSETAQKLK